MTVFFASSVTATNGMATLMFNLKSLMVSGGWTVVSSADGLTTISNSDLVTSDAFLTNSNAWFTIRQPAGATGSHGGVQREFGFQRTTNNSTWRIIYSHHNSLQGGNKSTLPTANDMQYIIGDSSTGVNLSGNADGSYRFYIYVDNTAPYPVWACAQTGSQNSGLPSFGFFIEPLQTGSWVANVTGLDPDPFIFYAAGTNSNNPFNGDGATPGGASGIFTCDSGAGATNSPRAYMGKGTVNQVWAGVGGFTFTGNNSTGAVSIFPLRMGPNALTSNYDLAPIIWGRTSTSLLGGTSFKGVGYSVRWKTSASMNTLDTVTISQTNDHIVMRDVVLPWTGSATIIQ